jgi:hypothetical protein
MYHLKQNKWELLATLQAILIFVLVRLEEGETEHNNFDFLLGAAVTVGSTPASFLLPRAPVTIRHRQYVNKLRNSSFRTKSRVTTLPRFTMIVSIPTGKNGCLRNQDGGKASASGPSL